MTDTRLWYCALCLAPAWVVREPRDRHMREVHGVRPTSGTGYRLMQRLEAAAPDRQKKHGSSRLTSIRKQSDQSNQQDKEHRR